MLREALEIRRQQFADDHVMTAEANGTLGLCLLAQNVLQEAIPLLRASVPVLKAERGADDPLVREIREALDQGAGF